MADEIEVAKAGIDLVEKYADKLTDVLSQYSGPAADLALAVGRVAALKEIIVGTALVICFGYAAYRLSRIIKKEVSRHTQVFDCEPFLIIFPGAGAVLAGVAVVAGCEKLTNVFAWVGMFHPEVYLAAKALGL